jgi:tetrapyrrole methylase family protein / MazG family protein
MRDFDRLVEIVKILRSPNGCPWDKAQTLESIVENIIEEAYEVVDGINKKDYQKIKEEVGDLILQGVFISQIAEEENKFSLEEALRELNEKLIHRHPHVFKNENLPSTTDEALKVWESKKNEDGDIFSLVPKSLPTLLYIYKVIQKAKRKNLLKISENDVINEIKNIINNLDINNNDKVRELILQLSVLLGIRNEKAEVKIKEEFKEKFTNLIGEKDG